MKIEISDGLRFGSDLVVEVEVVFDSDTVLIEHLPIVVEIDSMARVSKPVSIKTNLSIFKAAAEISYLRVNQGEYCRWEKGGYFKLGKEQKRNQESVGKRGLPWH